MLSKITTLLVMILKAKVSLRAKRGNLTGKMYLFYEIATSLRS